MPILNETFSSLRPADQAAITAVAPLVESGAIDKFSPQAFVTANLYIALNNNVRLRWGGCHLLRSFIVLKVIIPLVRAMKKKTGRCERAPSPPPLHFPP